MNLISLGWNDFWEEHFRNYQQPGFKAGRIAAEYKGIYRVYTEKGDFLAGISGKMRYQAAVRDHFPAVGDWVVLRDEDEASPVIHAVLPRKSKFSRKVAGKATEEQIIAANVDTVFLVTALNKDFNLRRIERYLTLAWESGANPVIVLSKADLCQDIPNKVQNAEAIALGVPVYVISSITGQGIESLEFHLGEGRTVALLGSSGAGKSTLINRLMGKPAQRTRDIRQGDDRGKHTTTSRELFLLPRGGLVVDTPGLRELQLWDSHEGFHETFEDVEFYAGQCRFTDCRHTSEPGCAVKRALAEGKLDPARFNHYLKLQKELAYLSRKENQQELLADKARWKKIHKEMKHYKPR
ncbi:ribosome small subunit-dependent GTPase A [Desulforamulus ruminis]|uniref:Small ribosomal subunit biogenesis GTPase RsgA n=1 Tax=Desulforamulus ruminis (strain ATCC 23193 / DSM 2154 / NCIMB 8452 / DL) TaxID=696281 RepID=F6DKM1_DESRL|nr:ribosome small subunit-dependent GTPase A [Desulforamulus ruminis]AEG60396.1 ribosome small subunit-dependent GTPase A [Desulforamulus ruminis DSM 2154]